MALYLQVKEQELKHGLTKKLNGTMDIPQLSVESATTRSLTRGDTSSVVVIEV